MTSPPSRPGESGPPSADPKAIRACLTPTLAAEFDNEWQIVLERVKQSQELGDLHKLLNKWRHTAYLEMREPGAYYRLLARAEEILRAGGNPDAASFEDMMALVRQRRTRGTAARSTRTTHTVPSGGGRSVPATPGR